MQNILCNNISEILNETSIISITDKSGIIEFVSKEFCNISGYKEEELIGKSHNIVRHPDMHKKIFENMWKTILSGKKWKGIVKNLKKDGGYYFVKSQIIPLLDETNNIYRFLSIRTDITSLIDNIEELNNYKKGLDNAGCFLKLDKFGRVVFANSSFLKETGYDKKILIGYPLLYDFYKKNINMISNQKLENFSSEVCDISYIIDENKYLEESILKNKTWKGLIKLKTNKKTIIYFQATIVPILDGDKQVKEYIVIGDNVTELELAKNKLKLTNQKLKDLDNKKTEFLNIASHELRTPMTSIKGYLSMLLDGDFGELNQETKNIIKNMYDSSNRQINLINDMLDIAKLESNETSFFYEDFDILSFVDSIIIDLKPIAKNKNIDLISIYKQKEIIINTDKNKLKQIILNLLSNAIKFTNNGGKVETIIQKNKNFVQIKCKDNGIGIPKDQQKQVFEKFTQVKNSLTRDINGTGLGLPIVKQIVKKLSGTIELNSQEGIGTEITITLPLN